MADTESTYTVDIDNIETAIQAGDALTVAVTIKNEGDAGEDDVTLLVDGSAVETETLELERDGTETIEFEWAAPPETVGTVDITVETTHDSTAETVTVEEAPAAFAVGMEADEHASAGGTVSVAATIENEGTLAGTRTVEFRVDEETAETETLELDGQESETLEFIHHPTEEDAPEVTLAVSTDDDEAETTVEIVTESVTPMREFGSKSGMGLFGWLMFIGMIIVLLPLLPFIALIKLVDMLTGGSKTVR